MPLLQADRAHHQARVQVVDERADLAQRAPVLAVRLGGDGEDRDVVHHAQEAARTVGDGRRGAQFDAALLVQRSPRPRADQHDLAALPGLREPRLVRPACRGPVVGEPGQRRSDLVGQRSTGTSAASGSVMRAASPTTTPVSRAGAKNRAGAALTSSTVAASSRDGCAVIHSRPSPNADSAESVDARPACVAVDSASVPIAYWRTDSTSVSVTGSAAIRPSSYSVSSTAGAVTSVATSTSRTSVEPSTWWSTRLCG